MNRIFLKCLNISTYIWGQLGNEMVGKFRDCGVNIFHFCEHEWRKWWEYRCRRNRDFSLSRLPRVIASDSASSFRFTFLAFTDVRLKPVEADNEQDFRDLYASRSQESHITCMTLMYGSIKALGRTPNSPDSNVSMLIKKTL